MDLEIVLLSEVSQRQISCIMISLKYHMLSLQKRYTWTYLQNKSRLTDIGKKKKKQLPKEAAGGEGISWEFEMNKYTLLYIKRASQVALVGKNPPANVGDAVRDTGSTPGLRRSPGEGNGYPLQYSCWRISWTMDRGAWRATVYRVTESQTPLK